MTVLPQHSTDFSQGKIQKGVHEFQKYLILNENQKGESITFLQHDIT